MPLQRLDQGRALVLPPGRPARPCNRGAVVRARSLWSAWPGALKIVRQMFKADDVAIAERDRKVQCVAQLPDIAGPALAAEKFKRGVGQLQ